jgi:hypothetical protein
MSALAAPRRTRFADVLAMEWTKVTTVPSTFFAVALTLVIGIGLSALVSGLVANAYAHDTTPGLRAAWDPTAISTAGGALAQIALAVLATLVITGEYATGEIRSTFVAVPSRWRVLLGKSAVVAAIGFVTAEVFVFVAFLIGQQLFSGHAPTASLSQPGVLRALVGGGLYVALLSVAALSLGTLLRGTASTVVVLVITLYVLPPILGLLPKDWSRPLLKYWPTEAGQRILAVVARPHTLGPWAGLSVMAGFTLLLLAVAAYRLERADV